MQLLQSSLQPTIPWTCIKLSANAHWSIQSVGCDDILLGNELVQLRRTMDKQGIYARVADVRTAKIPRTSHVWLVSWVLGVIPTAVVVQITSALSVSGQRQHNYVGNYVCMYL